jgi:probable phosphoglycerate mutase
MLLYLTRHGETDYNRQGRYCGRTDVPLNETGVAQARKLIDRLQDVKLDAVISSPMLRARQTAEIVCAARGMEYVVYGQFAERSIGIYEGLTREECRERFPDLWEKYGKDPIDTALEGGETVRQACARVDEGMALLRRDFAGKTVLLVCHGFVSRAIHRYCNNLSFDEMAEFWLLNCELVEYEVSAITPHFPQSRKGL